MKVALVGYEANIKNRVGSNQYAFELIRAIYKFDKKNNYTVFLPSRPLSDLPEPRKNWSYRVVGPPKLWNIFGLSRALLFSKEKFDLVFNPGHYCPLFSVSPLVVSIMDLGFLRFPAQFTVGILLKLRFWTAFSIKKACHLFSISLATENDLVKNYLIDPQNITVTYPGYDQEKFHTRIKKDKIKKVKRKYRITGNYLLYLGTLKPNKNIEGLLKAFALLSNNSNKNRINSNKFDKNSRHSKITLVIAGRKGWLYEKIYKNVSELGLEKKVIFTDFVPDDDIPALMVGSKAFVLPSFWEGFGIPVLEAMACGVPVVASNVGSLPEVVGDAGLLVDPRSCKDMAEKLAEILYNRKVTEKCRVRGLARAKNFSWEKCARQTLEVLESLVEKHRKKRK